ncbi:YtzH-like family protein [Bacillus sp. CLL-7-23]|uniref:YtzH-like family protein n=1 Tax=Bacillus changyiensis TaxID=3004103 RepID=A0ABT4X527_9BACI|nr:YtzH-like family protein [Bacillus changyiensis]MDA7027280.1 YtzH-like family protein [Bacillus changyiensis]
MGLNHENQMHLLKDILSDHQADCSGTVAECEQVERIIKSLYTNIDLDANFKGVLEDIYLYSQRGKSSPSIQNHILEHQDRLTQWVEEIDSFS